MLPTELCFTQNHTDHIAADISWDCMLDKKFNENNLESIFKVKLLH